MSSKILILGKGGQVSTALMSLLGDKAINAGPDEANFLAADFIPRLEAFIGNQPISAVINAAAYTAVDKAEGEGREDAFRLNATAVGELAAWCKEKSLPLVHYSTDYVFDGSGTMPKREDDTPGPLNAYGESKLAGEQAMTVAGGDHLIFRTSWLYDAHGKNFVNTMLRLFREKDSLDIVADQVGAPTYVPHLAKVTLYALEEAARREIFPSGLYHICHSGETSWHGFAQEIFALARMADSGQASSWKCQQLNPVPTAAYPTPAQRPLNSRLDCSHAGDVLGIALPHWKTGLKECIEEIYAGSRLQDSRSENHPAQGTRG